MRFLVSGLLTVSFGILSCGKVVINEIAFGGSSYGRCPSIVGEPATPWMEFYNDGSRDENLTGYELSCKDKKDKAPVRWVRRRRTLFVFGHNCIAPVLQPREHLQVCKQNPEEEDPCLLPDKFGTDCREYILKNSSGRKTSSTKISEVSKKIDIVWARNHAQSGQWMLLGRATPGEVNTNCTLQERCKDCPFLSQYNPALNRCECSAGSTLSSNYTLECQLCSTGRHNPTVASLHGNSCQDCSEGTYSDVERRECLPCSKDTYASSGSGACISCPQGMLTRNSMAKSLKDCICEKGSYASIMSASIPDSESWGCTGCAFGFTTPQEGALTKEDCVVIGTELIIIIAIGSSLLASLIILIVIVYIARNSLARKRREKSWLEIVDSIKCIISLQFPLILMSATDFLAMGQLHCLERCLANSSLCFLHTVEEIEAFTKSRYYVFFSHQWVAFQEPDPQQIQYACMKQALQALISEKCWDDADVYVWLDFFSIPQIVQCTKQLAINSLPIYAAHASAFVIVAPPAPHKDTGAICNLDTYKARLWCRAEQVSHFAKGGTNNMYFHDGKSLQKINKDSWTFESFFVFDGECTCCRLEHKNMSQCDKEYLVRPMLGLYIAMLLEHSKSPEEAHSYIFMTKHEHRIFPESFETIFAKEDQDLLSHAYHHVTQPFLKRNSTDLAIKVLSEKPAKYKKIKQKCSLFPKILMREVHRLTSGKLDFSLLYDRHSSQGIADYQYDYRNEAERSDCEENGVPQEGRLFSKDRALPRRFDL